LRRNERFKRKKMLCNVENYVSGLGIYISGLGTYISGPEI
jgi:hypothetical protein